MWPWPATCTSQHLLAGTRMLSVSHLFVCGKSMPCGSQLHNCGTNGDMTMDAKCPVPATWLSVCHMTMPGTIHHSNPCTHLTYARQPLNRRCPLLQSHQVLSGRPCAFCMIVGGGLWKRDSAWGVPELPGIHDNMHIDAKCQPFCVIGGHHAGASATRDRLHGPAAGHATMHTQADSWRPHCTLLLA